MRVRVRACGEVRWGMRMFRATAAAAAAGGGRFGE